MNLQYPLAAAAAVIVLATACKEPVSISPGLGNRPSEQRVAGYHPANGRGDRSVGGPGPDGRLHGTPLDRPRCLL